MTELTASKNPARRRGLLFYVGAAGLATATVIETIAVTGRWLSLPLHGALEIIQSAILVTACVSMLSATLEGTHATVQLLLNRVSPQWKRVLTRGASLISAAFFTALAIASIWLTVEHWNGHEETELLHLPLWPLRILCSVSMAAIVVVFAYRALKPRTGKR